MSMIYVRCRGRDRSALSKAASGRTEDILAAARAQGAARRSAEPGAASSGCPHRFEVECREIDQVLICPLCKEFSTFVNLGVFDCGQCGHAQRISLLMRPVSGRCDQCGHESPPFLLNTPESQLRYWPLEHHPVLGGNFVIQWCRLSSFQGSEGELEFAKEALDRAYQAGWYGFRNPERVPRAMFIRGSGLGCIPDDDSIPCAFRTYHAYCNFPCYREDKNNLKFWGTVAGFATGWPFQVTVDEGDCEDVWLGDKELLEELNRFPNLAKYQDRFKVI